MKPLFIILSFVFLLSRIYAQENAVTAKDLQGTWRLALVTQPLKKKTDSVKLPEIKSTGMESDPDDAYPNKEKYASKGSLQKTDNDVYLFKGDTLWELNYPCELNAVYYYSVDSGYLKIQYYPDVKSRLKLTLKNDTLCMSGDPQYGSSKLIRTTLNKDTVRLLLADSINPVCLIGEWTLYSFDDDGSSPPLKTGTDVPFDPAFGLLIKSKNLPKAPHSKKLTLMIAGKKRVFNYQYRNDGILELRLLNWKKADGTTLILYYTKN